MRSSGTQEERLRRTLTRREFLKISGAGVAGASLLAGCERAGVPPDLPGDTPAADRNTNVVLIIMDSLRKDHIGAYGNEKIGTPNLDALAKDSLLFSRAYPESAPTICARRAIHTGLRTWPFEDWRRYKGIDVGLQGWQPIPNYQTTLAETMRNAGYETLFVTDNLQQYDASMNFHRGFEAFDFIRGRPQTATGHSIPALREGRAGAVEQSRFGNGEQSVLSTVLRQHGAPQIGRGLVRPAGLHPGLRVSGGHRIGEAFLPYGGLL